MRALTWTVLAAALVAIASPAWADFGVGLMVGEPTGLSFKWRLTDGRAVDAATGWSVGEGNFYAHGDYLWQRMIEDEEHGVSVPLYFGIGGRLLLRGDDSKFGARIPIGLTYLFEDGKFDVFVEIVPIFNLIPDTDFGFAGGVGARYYF